MLMLSLPSVFQTPLVAPLHCSCALFWWQIPVWTFSMPLLSSPCWKVFKADRQRCFLVLSTILLLLCFSSPLPYSNHSSFLSPSPPSDFSPSLGSLTLLNHISSQLLPKSMGWSPKGAWCLKGWVSNKSGVEVVQGSVGDEMEQGEFIPFAGCSNPWLIITNNGWKCAWDIS